VEYVIPEEVLKHVIRKHGVGFSRVLGINRLDLLKRLLEEALINPDEVHMDSYNPSIKYFLKKVDGLWLTIIVLENEVRTAYLISSKTYKRFVARRWL
jgi:hypothetical protein